ncbi:hypothetical protein ABZ957_34440 [Streptomyces sp. NPDC046316]|uniref:hypothetical protein n=1 Tax=Streptomyces sp. NPDC046316 TaxID=3154494 RepID=UPI0033EC08B6
MAFIGFLAKFLFDSLDPLEESSSRYLGHLSRSDGRAACSVMTRTAQVELIAVYRTEDCPAAIGELLEPLTPDQRGWLEDTETRYPAIKGRLGYVELGDNPLGLTQLVLVDVDGTWLITELK